MVWLKVLVLGISLISEGDSRKSRILQGRDATIDQFPYQASLRKDNFHFCGGTVISEEHILTAAHCISGIMPTFEEVTVHTGTSHRTSVGNVHKIADITIHPMFEVDATRSVNDIAVIMLKDRIVFNEYQQKINLPRKNFKIGQKVNLTGWGTKWPNPLIYPYYLQVLYTEVMSREECQEKMINPEKTLIYPTEVCTRNEKNSGACSGDSGSPVAANGEIVGIVSWRDGDILCGSGIPDVHTNVFEFRNFIESAMNLI